MSREWFCSIHGVEKGPLSANDLRDLVASGTLGPRDFVRRGSTHAWVMAERVNGLSFGRVPEDQATDPAAKSINSTGVNAAKPSGTQATRRSDAAETYTPKSAQVMLVVRHELLTLMARLGLQFRYGAQSLLVVFFQGLTLLAEMRLGRKVALQNDSATELAQEAELKIRQLRSLPFTSRFGGYIGLLTIYRKLGSQTLRQATGEDSTERRLAASLCQRAQDYSSVRQSLVERLAAQAGAHPISRVRYVAAGLILLVAIVSYALIGWYSDADSRPVNVAVTSEGDAAPSAAGVSEQALTSPAAPSDNATVIYWRKVRQIIGSDQGNSKDPAAVRVAILSAARKLTDLSVLGVDERPVEWVVEANRLFRDVAATEEYFSSADYLVNSFLHGADGRPLEGVQQYQTARQEISRRLRELSNRFTETELLISRRYGVEFSPAGN